jgi:hypothetical protein
MYLLFYTLCVCFETGSYCLAQADLTYMILLPQSLKCWDYSKVPPSSLYYTFYYYFRVYSFCSQIKAYYKARHGGTHLQSQHLVG